MQDGCGFSRENGSAAGGGGPAQHEMFFPCTDTTAGGLGLIGDFRAAVLNMGGGLVNTTWYCPLDWGSTDALDLVLIPLVNDAAANLDIFSDYGAAGQAYNTHSAQDLLSTYNLVANQLYELDITSIYANLAAGDYCGVRIDNNTLNVMGVLGVRFLYTYA